MRIPSFERLGKDSSVHRYYIRREHPSQKFYEYKWWVFHSASPCDGSEFLADRYSMSREDAFSLIERIESEAKPCWVYNKRIPKAKVDGRDFWNRLSAKWSGVEFAE